MPKVFQGVKCVLIGVSNKQRQIISKNILREDGAVLNHIATSGSLSTSAPSKISKSSSVSKSSNSIINNFIQRNAASTVSTPAVTATHTANPSSSGSLPSPSSLDQSSQASVNMEYINKECTHIVSEQRNLTSESLSHYLQCPITEIVNLHIPIVHTSWISSSLAAKSKLNETQFQILINDNSNDTIVPTTDDGENNRQSKKSKTKDSGDDVGLATHIDATAVNDANVDRRPVTEYDSSNVLNDKTKRKYDDIATCYNESGTLKTVVNDLNSNNIASASNLNTSGNQKRIYTTPAVIGETTSSSLCKSHRDTDKPSIKETMNIDHPYNSKRNVVMSKLNTRIDIIAPLKTAQFKHIPMLPFLYTPQQADTPSSSMSSSQIHIQQQQQQQQQQLFRSHSPAAHSAVLQSHSYTLDESRLQAMYAACSPEGQWHEYNNMIFKLSPWSNSNNNSLNISLPSSTTECASSSSSSSSSQYQQSPIASALPKVIEYIGFDLDGTLIKTQSGRVFPKDEKDWIFWSNDVKKKVKQIILDDKKHVVIISNQNGIAKGKITRKQLHTKVDSILTSLYSDIYGKVTIGGDSKNNSGSSSSSGGGGNGTKNIMNYFHAIAPPPSQKTSNMKSDEKAASIDTTITTISTSTSSSSSSSSSSNNDLETVQGSEKYIGGIDFICSIDSDDTCRKPLTGCWDLIRWIRENQLRHVNPPQVVLPTMMKSSCINNDSCHNTNANLAKSENSFNSNNDTENHDTITTTPNSTSTSTVPSTASGNLSSAVAPVAAVTMSLFVGDAAGRQGGVSPKTTKDFSDSDIKFALNVGCDFATPEEYFTRWSGVTAKSEFKGYTPLTVTASSVTHSKNDDDDEEEKLFQQRYKDELINKILTPAYTTTTTATTTTAINDTAKLKNNDGVNNQQLEIVLLVAPPACGKSTIACSLFVARKGYVRINRDTLGTIDKCIQHARIALRSGGDGDHNNGNMTNNNHEKVQRGRSVVVDNANTEIHQRNVWIQLAQELKIPIRCICIETSLTVALSLQQIRLLSPDITHIKERKEIPEWVIEKFFKECKLPQLDEGFTRIDTIPFLLDFNTSNHPITKRLYESYL